MPNITPGNDCPAHAVTDQRGTHTAALPVPRCDGDSRYGAWDENDGGFVFIVDCAKEAANWAAERLDEDPDGEMVIKAICREHEEQSADGCEDCNAEDDAEADSDEDDEDEE